MYACSDAGLSCAGALQVIPAPGQEQDLLQGVHAAWEGVQGGEPCMQRCWSYHLWGVALRTPR